MNTVGLKEDDTRCIRKEKKTRLNNIAYYLTTIAAAKIAYIT